MSASPATLPDWVRSLAGAGPDPAAGAVVLRGLPTRRDEAWRYLRLDSLRRGSYAPVTAPPAVDVAVLPAVQGPRLVFVAGHLAPALSTLDALPEGLAVEVERPAAVEGGPDEGFFPALGRIAAGGGARLRVTATVRDPIELLHLPGAEGVLAAPAIQVGVAAGAGCTLIERMHPSATQALMLPQERIRLDAGATFDHVLLLAAADAVHHVGRTEVNVGSGATYRAWMLAGGGALVRQDLAVQLAERGAACEVGALLAAAGTEQVDLHVSVAHAAPDTRSRVQAKGIAGGQGRVVLNGRVLVHAGADGTNARLDTGNLLLSERAEVNVKPELEIYADDVQCAHGATVGQLDENQRYYLQSRGIGAREARALLIGAFARDVFGALTGTPVQAPVEAALTARLSLLAAEEGA